MKLPPLVALRAFEAVSRHKSIRQAAAELNVEPSAVSRHLRTLQGVLDVKLVNASRRGITLTDEGLQYAAEIGPAFAAIAYATTRLAPEQGTRNLVIWSVPGFALHWLTPRLPTFRERHPKIDVLIRPTEAHPDLITNEADIEIAYGAVRSKLSRSINLAKPRVYPVASSAWVKSARNPTDPAALLSLTLIHEESHEQWHDWFAACGVEVKRRLSGPRLWHSHLALEAAKRGQGIALANDLLVAEDIANGSLVEVGKTHVVLAPYTFLARKDRWNEPAVARFRTWLLSTLAARI